MQLILGGMYSHNGVLSDLYMDLVLYGAVLTCLFTNHQPTTFGEVYITLFVVSSEHLYVTDHMYCQLLHTSLQQNTNLVCVPLPDCLQYGVAKLSTEAILFKYLA